MKTRTLAQSGIEVSAVDHGILGMSEARNGL